MPNHVHLVLVPGAADGLHRAPGEVHRRYTRRINFQKGWKGYLWQGRFASCPMDEAHLRAAARSAPPPSSRPWSAAPAAPEETKAGSQARDGRLN
jgi:putative transposase